MGYSGFLKRTYVGVTGKSNLHHNMQMVRTQDSFDGRRVMAGHRLLSVRSERLLNYINAHLKEVDIDRYM